MIWLFFILDEIAQGLVIEFCTAIIADFLDVVPHITCAEVHATLIRSVLMLALGMLEHLQEVGQADPLPMLTSAFAHLTGSIASVGFAFHIGSFTHRQVGFTITVRAAI